MKTKLLIMAAALVLAGVAAFVAMRYLQDARGKIASESQPIKVYVAQTDVPRGTSAEEMIAKEMVVLQDVPMRFVCADPVSSQGKLSGMVLAAPLIRGQQLTTAQFEAPDVAGLAYSIPKQQLALTIPVDEVSGVGGLVKPGDHVVLYATFSPGPKGEKDFTKLLVPDVKVIAVGTSLRSSQTEQPADASTQKTGGLTSRSQSDESKAPKTLTLALAPADVERVVFAEEAGRVWCALLPATTDQMPASAGQTIRTVVR